MTTTTAGRGGHRAADVRDDVPAFILVTGETARERSQRLDVGGDPVMFASVRVLFDAAQVLLQ